MGDKDLKEEAENKRCEHVFSVNEYCEALADTYCRVMRTSLTANSSHRPSSQHVPLLHWVPPRSWDYEHCEYGPLRARRVTRQCNGTMTLSVLNPPRPHERLTRRCIVTSRWFNKYDFSWMQGRIILRKITAQNLGWKYLGLFPSSLVCSVSFCTALTNTRHGHT